MNDLHQGAKEVIKIRLLKGGKVVRSYKVRSSVLTIGSREGCTIRAAGDSSLAPKHASIYVEGGELSLVPEPDALLLLNGEKVDYAVPGPEDIIQAGRLTFRVELASQMESQVPDSAKEKSPPAVAVPSVPPVVPRELPKPSPAAARTMLGMGAVDPSEGVPAQGAEEPSGSRRLREEALNPFARTDEEAPTRLSWRADSLLPGISRESKVPLTKEGSKEEQAFDDDRETFQDLAAKLYTRTEDESDPYIQASGLPGDPTQPVYDEAALYFSEDEEDSEFSFVEPFDLAGLLLAQDKGTEEGVEATPRHAYCAAHVVRVVHANVAEIGSVLPRQPFRFANRELACWMRGRQLCLEVQKTVSGEIQQGEIRTELSDFPEKKGVRRLRLNQGDSAVFQGHHGIYKVDVYRPPAV